MASAYSSANGHWRSRVVTDVTDETATTITIRVRAYWCSIAYGFAVGGYGTASCGSYNSNRTRFTASSDKGETREQLVCSVSHKYNKSSSKQNITCKAKIEITGGFENGTRTATVTHTIPAIDYDAPNAPAECSASRSSDKQAKVTWENGSTSTTRPRSSTKVNRKTDGGDWSEIASVGSSTENYTDNGIATNHRYQYRVRAYGAGGYSGYATSDYIYTTPGKPSSVTATKTGAQSVQLAITGAAPYATSYAVERSTDGGSQWEPAGTPTSFPWVDSEAPAGTVVYRVAAVRGSLQSAWVQSNAVTTITPPLAPAVSGLPSVAATGSTLTVTWVPNHPDGSEQTSAEVEYTVGDGSLQTATVEGAATSYQLPESVTESAATVKVRVRTHGLDEEWGAWSGYSTVTVAVPPQAHFTNPAEDGAAVTVLPLVLTWEATDSTGIASQTLELVGADGGSLLSVQLAGDVRSLQIDDSVYALSNLSDYELVLTVLGGSSLATVAERQFSTDWAEPSTPEADLDVDPADLSCAVTVHGGEQEGAEASIAEVPEGKTVGGAVVYGNTVENLWPAINATMNGITVSTDDTGLMTVSGTSTAETYIISEEIADLPVGSSVTLTSTNYGAAGVWRILADGIGGATITGQSTFTAEKTAAPNRSGCVAIVVTAGQTVDATFRVMLVEGTEASDGYYPPGLNSVDELSIVTAGKNLLTETLEGVAPAGRNTVLVDFGEDVTADDMTFSVIADTDVIYNLDGDAAFVNFLSSDGTNNYIATNVVFGRTGTTKAGETKVISIPDVPFKQIICYFRNNGFSKFDDGCRLKLQLERGSTASAYEPHRGSTFTVDLDGNALGSYGDGTRDELRIEPDGSCSIAKASGGTVELPPVPMAFDGPGVMYAVANVPATVKPVYMVGSSFSVTRVLADGSQWLVADGLEDGQECIDPLPPLNVDYSYLVTAYAETGASSALTVPARVDAVLAAFNFGDAAAVCELARLDPSWSHSPKRSGTLYHFADGGEAGGLPVPYSGADVDSTRSMGFTVLDLDQLRRLQGLAAKYYTCWYRDVYGGRALCAASWSFSSGIPYGKVEVSADMTEAVFEEAW